MALPFVDVEGVRTSNSSTNLGSYETFNDVRRKYRGCIVYIDTKAYSIIEVGRPGGSSSRRPHAVLLPMKGSGSSSTVILFHKLVNSSIPDLGYVNHKGYASYLTKVVGRQFKQGLSLHSISLFTPYKDYLHSFARVSEPSTVRLSSIAGNVNLHDVSYPSFEEAYATIVGRQALSVAVSKDVAIAINPRNAGTTVFYRDLAVGHIDTDGGIHVKERFLWINDTIQEALS